MPFAQINGFRMHYQVTGQGPPLVLAHGLMGSIAMNEAITAVERPTLLADSFTVINYDARGHGESGHTDNRADYSWSNLAEDMYGLLRHLRVERAHVGGGSLGAATSLAFTVAHPDMVERLVLICPPPLPLRTDGRYAGATAVVGGVYLAFAGLIEKVGMEQAADTVTNLYPFTEIRKDDPQYYEMLVYWMKRQNGPGVVAAIRGLMASAPLPVERFPEIKAPALIICHPNDPIHPLESAEMLKATLPSAELFRVPSQTFYRERPEEVAAAIKQFLGVRQPAQS